LFVLTGCRSQRSQQMLLALFLTLETQTPQLQRS